MAKTKKIEIWGGFHNRMDPITVRVPADFDMQYYGLPGLLEHGVSESTRKRIERHMCGLNGCLCSLAHNWKWERVE